MFKKFSGIIMIVIAALLVLALLFYGFLWLRSIKKYPVEYGISFSVQYAEALGLDWQDVYKEMLQDLKPEFVRIAAPWNVIEPQPDVFDFNEVDWLMDQAAEHGTKAILVVGQKAPRWPECHVPGWLNYGDQFHSGKKLMAYVEQVVERYKNHPALELWQVENEPFIRFKFGECELFRPEFTFDEIELVRKLDPDHKIILTDSGELSTWRKATRAGDLFGTTLYRVIGTPSGRFFTYDWLPAAFYRFKAKLWAQPLDQSFVSELQAEPWFPNGDPHNTSLEVMAKSMSISRLQKNIDYAQKIGFKRVYFWGVEWWYFMGKVHNDNSYWEHIQNLIAETK